MTLYDELTTGPLATELAEHIASGNDTAIAEILNRKDIDFIDSITIDEFSIWAAKTGMRAIIQDHADNINSPLRSIALTLIDFLVKPRDTIIRFNLPANMEMLNAWVTAGILKDTYKNDLLKLSTKQISRAEQLNLVVSLEAIRREIWNDNGTRRL